MTRWGTVDANGNVNLGGGSSTTWTDPATGLKIRIDDDIDGRVQHLPEVKTKAKDVAQQIADYAASTAPVGETGNYRAGIGVEETKSGYRVIAKDQKSAWIEFGIPSQGQPARWILRTAVVACGYKFKKGNG